MNWWFPNNDFCQILLLSECDPFYLLTMASSPATWNSAWPTLASSSFSPKYLPLKLLTSANGAPSTQLPGSETQVSYWNSSSVYPQVLLIQTPISLNSTYLSYTISILTNALLFFFFFWKYCLACEILVPRPGIEPRPLAVRLWSPNHWTAREFPH